MLKVRSAEEAIAMAKEMCSRHRSMVLEIGPHCTPRDVALKILLEELHQGEPTAKKIQRAMNQVKQQQATLSSSEQPSAGLDDNAPTSDSNFAAANLRNCPYCTEPSSRYCKETGRRHQNSEERAMTLWKKLYRRFALASQFVSSARLAKKNTCVEDYSVELDF